MNSCVGLYVQLDQVQLCKELGVKIKNELVTKYSGLKIAFPEDLFHGLEAINIRYLGDQYTLKNFPKLCEEDRGNLAKVGITIEKVKQIACLANYFAERYYLGKKDINQELELNELSNQGIQFTVMALIEDVNQAKNLAFNHSWQKKLV